MRTSQLSKKLSWGSINRHIRHIPIEFITRKKLENLILSLEAEKRGDVEIPCLPYHIVIEPTNVCNLKCPLCSTGSGSHNRPKGIMKLNDFKKIIDMVKNSALEVYLQNWGESTLHPYLPEMIKYASEKNIWTNLSTNFSVKYKDGYLRKLIASGLAVLHVDIDGTTQDVYSYYRRGGSLNLVLKNIQEAVKLKKEAGLIYPVIEATMLVMRHNEHQMNNFMNLCGKLGVDKCAFGKIQLNPNSALSWMPKNKKYKYETYFSPDARPKKCHWPWSGIVINWDGNVSSCCIVDDIKADFGNIFPGGMQAIWNNESYISARAEFSDRNRITKNTICNVCKNNTHSSRLKRFGESFSLML